MIHRLVTRGCLAGKVALKEVATNDRAFVGIVLLVIAPAFWWTHLFFDWNTVVPGWYYKNWFYWFFTNREELTFAVGLTGFFLLCPVKWGYRYLLCPVVALCVSEVIYQSFQIDNWKDFYIPMVSHKRGWEVGIVSVVAAFALWKVVSYTVYRKYHLKDGNLARIMGIIKAPGISDEKKMDILEQLVIESENYNARV